MLAPARGHTPIVSKDDYYPFGLTFNSYQKAASTEQNYKFNGKEHISDLGLEWHDYGARMYMADLGRWFNVDPLADKYMQWSPYVYTINNPIRFIDPDGMQVGVEKVEDQELVRNTVSEEENQYVQFNKKGNIKKGKLNRGVKKLGDKASENLKNLNSLVQSKDTYMVVSSDEFGEFTDTSFVPEDSEGYAESWGIVFESEEGEALVGKGGEFRPAEGTKKDPHLIMINKAQSTENQSATLAHEAYGHGYFFEKLGNTPEIGHQPGERYVEGVGFESYDKNTKLDQHIKRAEALTRQFMNQRKKKE